MASVADSLDRGDSAEGVRVSGHEDHVDTGGNSRRFNLSPLTVPMSIHLSNVSVQGGGEQGWSLSR